MNSLNQCNFIGNLTADVETRYLPAGDAVANFRIAVNWKSKDKEGAEFITVVAFGKLAEICSEYLRKASKVFISGRMRTRKYRAQDGLDRYVTEIVAEQMQMLDGRRTDDASPRQQQSAPPPEREPGNGSFIDDDFDVPF
jgi:single-strand DNA-binding protein